MYLRVLRDSCVAPFCTSHPRGCRPGMLWQEPYISPFYSARLKENYVDPSNVINAICAGTPSRAWLRFSIACVTRMIQLS